MAKHFLLKARDNRDHAYGCKSSTLEAVGILLPFICSPTSVAGREIILLTDNEPIVYGWDSRKVKNDESASILIRALHIISFFLGSEVTVRHLPRMATPLATLADQLSRSSTTHHKQLIQIRHAVQPKIPKILICRLVAPPIRGLEPPSTSPELCKGNNICLTPYVCPIFSSPFALCIVQIIDIYPSANHKCLNLLNK